MNIFVRLGTPTKEPISKVLMMFHGTLTLAGMCISQGKSTKTAVGVRTTSVPLGRFPWGLQSSLAGSRPQPQSHTPFNRFPAPCAMHRHRRFQTGRTRGKENNPIGGSAQPLWCGGVTQNCLSLLPIVRVLVFNTPVLASIIRGEVIQKKLHVQPEKAPVMSLTLGLGQRFLVVAGEPFDTVAQEPMAGSYFRTKIMLDPNANCRQQDPEKSSQK